MQPSPNSNPRASAKQNSVAMQADEATEVAVQLTAVNPQWQRVRAKLSGIWNANHWSATYARLCTAIGVRPSEEETQQTAALNAWEDEGGSAAITVSGKAPATASKN